MKKENLDHLISLLMLEFSHHTSLYIEERSTTIALVVTPKTLLGVTGSANGSLLDADLSNLT